MRMVAPRTAKALRHANTLGIHRSGRRAFQNWLYADWRILFGRLPESGFPLIPRSDMQPVKCDARDELVFSYSGAFAHELFRPDRCLSDFLEDLLRLRRRVIQRLRSEMAPGGLKRGGLGGWPGLKEALLDAAVLRFHPRIVVETGVAQGVSTTFLLSALHSLGAGRLISVDLPNYDPAGYSYKDGSGIVDPVHVVPRLGTGWLVDESLRSRWTLMAGRSSEILPTVSESVDMFLHDSLHSYENMTFEFEWALSHLRPGGILLVDDARWNRAFSDFLSRTRGQMVPLVNGYVGVAMKVDSSVLL
jgi:predicted O-methyltransferase YrrM